MTLSMRNQARVGFLYSPLLATARDWRSISLARGRRALSDGVEVGWVSVGDSVGDEEGTSVVGVDVG